MVALAVRAFGGVVTPSLARPVLESANRAFLSGRRVECAVLLREALRRYLVAFCASCRLDSEGECKTLLERLRASGFTVSCFIDDTLGEVDDIIALRDRGKYLSLSLECAFELIGQDNRKGGAL